MKYNILLIEDDTQICEIISDAFTDRGGSDITMTTFHKGAAGTNAALDNDYDLILLDVMLPDMDGFSVIRRIRKCKDVPVIFLTARTAESDILYGYDLGCDDYVTKPFSVAALYSKAIALIQRDKHSFKGHTTTCGNIVLNRKTLSVTASGEEILLPPIEFRLLVYLIDHKGWVVDRETLLDRIWGPDFLGGTRVVDNHVKNLRKLLKKDGFQIKTVISQGYKITD